MDIIDFTRKFSNQFYHTDPTNFIPDTNFWEINEWSSLIALSIVAMIEEEYGVALRSVDLKGVRTIRDLFNVVQEKMSSDGFSRGR